jgi:ribosomal protein L39E
VIEMSRYVHQSKKAKLAKAGRQTKWAPFWVIPKMFGLGRRVHPSRVTAKKRNWRRSKTNL